MNSQREQWQESDGPIPARLARERLFLWQTPIVERITERFQGTHFIGVGGSVLTERFNSGSDIDVLVLHANGESAHNNVLLRCPSCENRLLDVTFMPYFRFVQLLDMAPHAHSAKFVDFTLGMLALKDELGVAGPLRDHARRILQAGPGILTQTAVDFLRRKILSILNDARSGGDAAECRLSHIELIGLLMSTTLQWRRSWTSASLLWTYRSLKDLAQGDEFARRLVNAVDSGEQLEIFSVAQELLRNLGGVPDDGFSVRVS